MICCVDIARRMVGQRRRHRCFKVVMSESCSNTKHFPRMSEFPQAFLGRIRSWYIQWNALEMVRLCHSYSLGFNRQQLLPFFSLETTSEGTEGNEIQRRQKEVKCGQPFPPVVRLSYVGVWKCQQAVCDCWGSHKSSGLLSAQIRRQALLRGDSDIKC